VRQIAAGMVAVRAKRSNFLFARYPERISSQAHLGSGYKSEPRAKTALNPQVNKIQSHSFK
jgi:hypothetical protein